MSLKILFKQNELTDYLIEHWQKIRDEFISFRRLMFNQDLLQVQNTTNKLQTNIPHGKKRLYEGNIIVVALFIRKEILARAEAIALNWTEEKYRIWEDRLEYNPTLKYWLEKNRDNVNSLFFHAAQPGSQINHHYGADGVKDSVRVHLCLTADSACIFDIENERFTWEEGKLFAFDESGVWHGTKHLGTAPRLILISDINKQYAKEVALNWPVKDFVPVAHKKPPEIVDW